MLYNNLKIKSQKPSPPRKIHDPAGSMSNTGPDIATGAKEVTLTSFTKSQLILLFNAIKLVKHSN